MTPRSKSTLRRERTVLEWVLLGVSLAVIAAIVAALVAYGFSSAADPPALRAEISPSGGAFLLRVENRGGTTAEEVVVDVARGSERHEVEFKAVAKGDAEEATVALPGRGTPVARVTSYKEP